MSSSATLTHFIATFVGEKDLVNILSEIQANPPPQPALERAQIVIADTAVNARADILKEISDLAKTLLGIEEDFAAITRAIREIDSKKALQDANGGVMELLPTWISHHDVRCLLSLGFLWLFFRSSNRRIQACSSHLNPQLRKRRQGSMVFAVVFEQSLIFKFIEFNRSTPKPHSYHQQSSNSFGRQESGIAGIY
jgi:hypothetical protein